MKVNLKCGPSLEINKICGGGYIAAPVGLLFLGGTPTRELVGKYVVWVRYTDGSDGHIAQEEILSIEDDEGNLVKYGSKKFPGHPDYDPREAPRPEEEAFSSMKKSIDRKRNPNFRLDNNFLSFDSFEEWLNKKEEDPPSSD